jgi:hypothetical protein
MRAFRPVVVLPRTAHLSIAVAATRTWRTLFKYARHRWHHSKQSARLPKREYSWLTMSAMI